MVYVLPCHFDARHRHGGTTVYNNRTINIFGRGCGSTHRCSGSSFGFGGGSFWGMLAGGLGMGLGMGLFNGLCNWLNGGSFFGGANGGQGYFE